MENDDTQPAYNALFVFGDSLSDNGAIFALTGNTFPPTELTGTDTQGEPVDFADRGIFFDQRFTNGPVYAEVATDLLEVPGDTTTVYDDLSGSNFAVGGATATDLTAFNDMTQNSLADQVMAFQGAVAALPGSDEQRAAFLAGSAASVFIGLNDLGPLGTAATTLAGFDLEIIGAGIGTIVQDISAGAQALADTGVGTIVLNKLPSSAFFPSSNASIDAFGPQTEVLFDNVSAQINAGIDGIAASLGAAGVTVEVVDFFSLAKEIAGDQETFGFSTLENALPNSDAETTLLIDDVPIEQIGFIDPVHFTAELHEVFGAFQAFTLGNAQITGDETGGNTDGTDADETIFAMGGDDWVRAGGGDDLIFAGEGRDFVFAGDGDDIAFGGAGNDLLLGEDGDDLLSGGSGIDFLLSGAGNSVLSGNAGDDVLLGNEGIDILIGGAGSNAMAGRGGDDFAIFQTEGINAGEGGLFFGGDGDDTLLIVSDTAIDDVDAYMTANNLMVVSVEAIEVVTQAVLADYDFGIMGAHLAIADLFGQI